MIKASLILFFGCLLFGTIGSHIWSFHMLGFILGVVIFIVGYCCFTLES